MTLKYALPAVLFLMLCPSNVTAQRGAARPAERARLLRELKKCETPGPPYDCDEMSVGRVVELYRRGDSGVLSNLMDAAPKSDGALSAALGAFFGELLCRRPRAFLSAAAARPRREHDKLLFLAAAGDGSGTGCRDLPGLRRRLRAISRERNGRLADIAGRCLEQVNKHNPTG